MNKTVAKAGHRQKTGTGKTAQIRNFRKIKS